MHLWVAAIGDVAPWSARLMRSLRASMEPYRLLDEDTTWTLDDHPEVFAAGVYTGEGASAPRRYVQLGDDGAVFYSGLPIDPTGAIEADHAEALAASWPLLPGLLEGRFSVVRAAPCDATVEVLTDPLGIEQVFVVEVDGTTLVANTVRVLERAAGLHRFDPLGLSLMLSMGWAGGDRTLRDGVRLVAGGRVERFQSRGRAVTRTTAVHFPADDMVESPRGNLRPDDVRAVSDRLIEVVATLGRRFGTVVCPLSGGLDSRLLAAVALASGARTDFYTAGSDDSPDVVTARVLAAELGFPHRVVAVTDDEVTANWGETVRRLLHTTDGLVTLKDPGASPPPVDTMSVYLHGFGGEIARSSFAGPRQVLALRRPDQLDALADRWVSRRGGMVTTAGYELALDEVRGDVRRWRARGARDEDIPDLVYTFGRTRRVAGANLRRRADAADLTPVLCTRPFIEAAFGIRALSRCAEPLHYEIVRLLSPELHRLPFARQGGWRPQSAPGLLAWASMRKVRGAVPRRGAGGLHRTAHGLTKESWVEERLPDISAVCLDVDDPVFWEVLDRPHLERLLSPRTDPAVRSPHWRSILAVATAAYYHADRRADPYDGR